MEIKQTGELVGEVALLHDPSDQDIALKLAGALERVGISAKIQSVLGEVEPQSANGVVAIWSRNSVANSDFVRAAANAFARGLLCSVRREACRPPAMFGSNSGVDLSDWNGDATASIFAEFVTQITELHAKSDKKDVSDQSGAPANYAQTNEQETARYAVSGGGDVDTIEREVRLAAPPPPENPSKPAGKSVVSVTLQNQPRNAELGEAKIESALEGVAGKAGRGATGKTGEGGDPARRRSPLVPIAIAATIGAVAAGAVGFVIIQRGGNPGAASTEQVVASATEPQVRALPLPPLPETQSSETTAVSAPDQTIATTATGPTATTQAALTSPRPAAGAVVSPPVRVASQAAPVGLPRTEPTPPRQAPIEFPPSRAVAASPPSVAVASNNPPPVSAPQSRPTTQQASATPVSASVQPSMDTLPSNLRGRVERARRAASQANSVAGMARGPASPIDPDGGVQIVVASVTDGGRYEGEWSNGRANGVGRGVGADGAVYSGAWRNSTRDGYGVLVYPNGVRYEGEFANNAPTGRGAFWDRDGRFITDARLFGNLLRQ